MDTRGINTKRLLLGLDTCLPPKESGSDLGPYPYTYTYFRAPKPKKAQHAKSLKTFSETRVSKNTRFRLQRKPISNSNYSCRRVAEASAFRQCYRSKQIGCLKRRLLVGR